jgi:hypothetical protein
MIEILESQKQNSQFLENSSNTSMRTGFPKADGSYAFRELVVPNCKKRQTYFVCGD